MKKVILLVASVLAGAMMMGSEFKSSATASVLGSPDTFFNTCGGYTKPATCNAQPHCTWRGSCVPR